MSASPIVRSVEVRCPPARAIELFVHRIDAWWPKGHRADAGELLLADGYIVERSEAGERRFARLVQRSDARLVFDWYLGTSEDAPTHVVATFTSTARGTNVKVVHSHGAAGVERFAQTQSGFQRGWQALLPALAQLINDRIG